MIKLYPHFSPNVNNDTVAGGETSCHAFHLYVYHTPALHYITLHYKTIYNGQSKKLQGLQ